jgi:predicted nuclease with TOPRIM domain
VSDPVEDLLAALDLGLLDELDALRARVAELEERVDDLAFELTQVENERDRLADRLCFATSRWRPDRSPVARGSCQG